MDVQYNAVGVHVFVHSELRLKLQRNETNSRISSNFPHSSKFLLTSVNSTSSRPFILEKSGLYIFDVPKRRCSNQILKFFRTLLSDTISVPISF